MKKSIFLLASLFIFATIGFTEAKTKKLGRQTLYGGINPNSIAVGGDVPTPPSPPPPPPPPESCAGCKAEGVCYNPVSDYSGCPQDYTPVKKPDGSCGCKKNNSATTCPENEHLNSSGHCVSNCHGVLCNVGYSPEANSTGCCCIADASQPEQPQTCANSSEVYHPSLHKCVPKRDYINYCLSATSEYCRICEIGYYLSHAFNGECWDCEIYISNCSVCQSNGELEPPDWGDDVICRVCKNGYTLSADGRTCE
ncbi:MAG: hypothetical protein J5787_03510 [Alphaproteobacteria bacterium]|nr:hypothetical protein [Alphaproteobacteria bacterium]